MKRLVILGAGGHGKVVLDVAKLTSRYQEIVFLDDAFEQILDCGGVTVAGVLDSFVDYLNDRTDFFVAMGSCVGRQQWLQAIQNKSGNITTLIHPSAVIADTATISEGVLVCAGAVINPDSNIGHGVIVNTRACIDHDCDIGAYSHICPGVSIAGIVTIGPLCWIGIGASVIQLVNIAERCVIGAGAVVIRSTKPEQTLVGVPAHSIR